MSLKFGKSKKSTSRRQWGSERRTEPLPILHQRPSIRKITWSRIAVVLTIILWAIYLVSTVLRQFVEGPKSFQFMVEAVFYVVVVTFLTFSALMYLIARQGAFQRFGQHVRVPRAELDKHFFTKQSSITVLVPSYSEETAVIRKTLLSAALQDYPSLKIVLLIDDKPNPTRHVDIEKLNETRSLAQDTMKLLAKPRKRFSRALASFEKNHKDSGYVGVSVIRELAKHYKAAVDDLSFIASNEIVEDHVDKFFTDQVLTALADELNVTYEALTASANEKVKLPSARVHQLYQRLAWTFNADISVFERKKYASLSHEANKAMNLNSYIGLMGSKYEEELTPDGPVLVAVSRKTKTSISIDDSDYILTLDADSILLRDYCLRLVYFLEQPGNERIAVTQTPYSSFRGAHTRIERLAAATTDIQHILHQGMSHYNATFWVGANAVIRKQALQDISETEWVGGFAIKRYIQDRTVIEDTESSVDLGAHGWGLVNYPERLSYSATPPDFGSLIVQRRRWANGGLLIMPKLWKLVKERQNRNEIVSRIELMLRVNYMASIAWASFGLVFLLAFPYDSRLLSPIVLLAALPYFIAMASDLKYCGYKRTDIFRIYGFNLIMLPVNMAGVLKSIQQALSGKKIPFARTPKVKNRTVSPILYVVAPLLIVAFSVLTMLRDIDAQNWTNAAFAGINAVLASWAIIAYVGIASTLKDIWHGMTDWLYVEVKPKVALVNANADEALDWRAVLYHGHAKDAVPLSMHNRIAMAVEEGAEI